MSSKKIIRYIVTVSILLTGCKVSLDEPRYVPGEADFSSFVAIGNSLTAGYSDGALSREGQLNSFPAILASKFALVGGGDFKMPLINEGNGLGFDATFHPIGRLDLSKKTNCLGQADFNVTNLSANPADLMWIGNQGSYNNLGVPGAKSFNLYSQYFGKGGGSGNPYYYRMASDTGSGSSLSSTVLGDAERVDPTFFSLWIGSNDVLFYALYGGEGSPSGLFPNDITPVDTFYSAIDRIVSSLTANGADGVIANIPDIADIPYFNTIPYNGLVLTTEQAAQLNALTPPNLGITFTAGPNAFVVKVPGGGSIRQLVQGELVLLSVSQDSIRCAGLGTPQNPIPASQILDLTELGNIETATALFNDKLRTAAAVKNLAFADMNTYFKSVSPGIRFNGVTFSAEYLSGGAFSLDGIHPNQQGYALIANVFIRSINARYKSSLPEADANSYAGIRFP
ncbi:SGNH/GDSL hydrolase family protein [soil metagenome]